MNPGAESAPVSQTTPGVTFLNPKGNEDTIIAANEIKTRDKFFQRFDEKIEFNYPESERNEAARQLAAFLVRAVYEKPSLTYNKTLTEQRKREKTR